MTVKLNVSCVEYQLLLKTALKYTLLLTYLQITLSILSLKGFCFVMIKYGLYF